MGYAPTCGEHFNDDDESGGGDMVMDDGEDGEDGDMMDMNMGGGGGGGGGARHRMGAAIPPTTMWRAPCVGGGACGLLPGPPGSCGNQARNQGACCARKFNAGNYNDKWCDIGYGDYGRRISSNYYMFGSPPPPVNYWYGYGRYGSGGYGMRRGWNGAYASTKCLNMGNAMYRPCCAAKASRGEYDSSCPVPKAATRLRQQQLRFV